MSRTRAVVAGIVLLAATVGGVALLRGGDDPADDVTVTWGGGEGHPPCVYDAGQHTVEAELRIEGTAPRRRELTVTVTAYADENTSRPVGSSSRTVPVDGTVRMLLTLTIAVDEAPHVDEDGVAACRLDVD